VVPTDEAAVASVVAVPMIEDHAPCTQRLAPAAEKKPLFLSSRVKIARSIVAIATNPASPSTLPVLVVAGRHAGNRRCVKLL
jgi:hypothetical protein